MEQASSESEVSSQQCVLYEKVQRTQRLTQNEQSDISKEEREWKKKMMEVCRLESSLHIVARRK
jgi:hypothetical protein